MSLKDYPEAYRAYLVKVDMRVLSHFVDYILENGADSYSQLSISIKMALKIALVLCYSRPFLEDNKSCEVNIGDGLTVNYLDEERVIHKNILEMHNKEIRESDEVVDNIKSFESNIVHISMHRTNSVPLEYSIVESIKEMAVKINKAADEIANNSLQTDIDIQRQPANEV
ncbi:MAG: hypothetical protein GKR92_02570 [Gammaproteobacteria bacterium]|nr:MAG: hypothetical protein GKR92_02570 [Gammaproteobacteria bacterium]